MTTGERIKAARLRANMTQEKLAAKLNTSYVVISQYENGKRNPKLETIIKIADALGVTPSTLLGEANILELVALDNNMTSVIKLLDLKEKQASNPDSSAEYKNSPVPAQPETGDRGCENGFIWPFLKIVLSVCCQ